MAEAVGVIGVGVELLIGAFLLALGGAKIRAGESAVIAAVARYEIGRRDHQRLFARLLPWIEIGIGVGLIFGLARDLTALAAGALLAAFELAMARSLWSGRRHACGCGGDRHSSLISWTLVLRNGVLVAALTVAALAQNATVVWSRPNLALAVVFLASTLLSVALHVRSRVRIKQALSVAATPSGT